MEQERYDIGRNEDDFTYWFYSEGPKDRIRKRVQFQHMPELDRNTFNLSFGDWDESAGKLNDLAISNNGDHLKVLHTIADAVREFINLWPDAIIWIKGSTLSRIRLYQMGIASYWKEKGVNYIEFLLFKKIN